MQFTLTIDCDNAAFGGNPAQEVAFILTRLLDTAPGYRHRNLAQADPSDRTQADPFVLLDSNGARVGFAQFQDID